MLCGSREWDGFHYYYFLLGIFCNFYVMRYLVHFEKAIFQQGGGDRFNMLFGPFSSFLYYSDLFYHCGGGFMGSEREVIQVG